MNRSVTRRTRAAALALAASAVLLAGLHAQVPPEELARRRYESGLTYAERGNYREALKDFQNVVDLFPDSSVASDAWLQIGRYYLEHTTDLARAEEAAETIRKKYSTSAAAAGAQILSGRVIMTRSRDEAALSEALATFDRVPRLFPANAAVAEALVAAGRALRLLGRPAEALERYHQVLLAHSGDRWAPAAGLGEGMALAAEGDYVGAIESFQRVRNRWLDSPEATDALRRQTILFRLGIRSRTGPAFSYTNDMPAGASAKLKKVVALAVTPDDALYYATDSGLGVLAGPRPDRLPSVRKPLGLALDGGGDMVVIEEGALRPRTGAPLALSIPRPGKEPRVVKDVEAAAILATRQWLIADREEHTIYRFSSAGEYIGPFATEEVARLAVSPYGDVAAIDRRSKDALVFDSEGKNVRRVSQRGADHTFKNMRDLAYDVFGHLYVLDEEAVVIFDRQLRVLHVLAPAERSPGSFRDATALALDSFGRLYVADDHAKHVRVYQ